MMKLSLALAVVAASWCAAGGEAFAATKYVVGDRVAIGGGLVCVVIKPEQGANPPLKGVILREVGPTLEILSKVQRSKPEAYQALVDVLNSAPELKDALIGDRGLEVMSNKITVSPQINNAYRFNKSLGLDLKPELQQLDRFYQGPGVSTGP